ncbi:hypothetical protein N1I02_001156 [Serratia marcescens]
MSSKISYEPSTQSPEIHDLRTHLADNEQIAYFSGTLTLKNEDFIVAETPDGRLIMSPKNASNRDEALCKMVDVVSSNIAFREILFLWGDTVLLGFVVNADILSVSGNDLLYQEIFGICSLIKQAIDAPDNPDGKNYHA